MYNDNKGSHAVTFTLGALIGGAVGFVMSTKKGRRFAKQTWQKVEPYLEDLVSDARDELEEVKTKVSEVKDAARGKIPANIKKPLKKTLFKGL